jgi:transposase-like protein
LRALAIREKKTYIHGKPVLPQALTEIFFDVEGLEDNFVYLLGIVVVTGGRVEKHSFWADKKEEETEIFLKCLQVVDGYDDYVLYHYGSYELSYLRRMKKKIAVDTAKIDRMIGNACNLLSVFYANVYVPTYTNGLKEIGNFLGFQWSEKDASGIQSIVWRKRWEIGGLVEYKEKLIEYNMEDCKALLVVKAFLNRIIGGKTSHEDQRINDEGVSDFVFLENLKKSSPFKFLTGEFALPEFEALNKSAHFDYQRERVHVRENTYLRKYYSKAVITKKRKDYRPNTSISSSKKEICPLCNKFVKKSFKPLSKKVVDLKLSKSGVRRWVIQLNSSHFLCHRCKKTFIPQWYKNVDKKYGHDLMAWTMYRHVIGGQSFRQIAADCSELFGIHMNKSNAHTFKSYIMEYYQETFEQIGGKILNSPVIYVDETPIKMTFESGYAWVLTNTEEVVSFYRPTREGEFITEYLADYKGVLVTDFYSAYDSLSCLQQKCLIHLIRDFNDDILKNPFDEEFKDMAKRFTSLLQDIVATIDKFGLKKRHLGKHNKVVAKFFKNILLTDFGSEVARQYQKRFSKNHHKLFLFLNHDNVSWNNNAAEHAIKLLATHKNKNLAFFRESRMEEYLKIMSIYQTCKYKGISFLQFMLSHEKDINVYCEKFLRKRKIAAMFG